CCIFSPDEYPSGIGFAESATEVKNLSFLTRNSKLATLILSSAILCTAPASAFAAPATTSHRTARKSSAQTTAKKSSRKSSKRRSAKRSWRSRGQRGIAADRVKEIQEALIREKYFNGEADGVW